jgi:hypothetical protein
MKMYRGVEPYLHHSWPRHQMEVRGRLHALAALPRGVTGTHWMGSRTGLNAVEKRVISYPCRESNPGRSARSLVAVPTEMSRLNLLGEIMILERLKEFVGRLQMGTTVPLVSERVMT